MGSSAHGIEARYAGTANGTLQVVTFWEPKAHSDGLFAEKLGPALAKVLGPETGRCTSIEVARSYVREPVA